MYPAFKIKSAVKGPVKTRQELFDRLIEITDIGWNNTVMKGYNPSLDRHRLIEDVSRDVTRLGIDDFAGLKTFMNDFEVHAAAQGRQDVCALHNLFWIRYYLGFDDRGRYRVPGYVDKAEPDALRLAALRTLVKNDADINDIADAIIGIVYHDLGEWPYPFLDKFGAWLLDEGRLDIAQDKKLSDRLKWGLDSFIPSFCSNRGHETINDGAYAETIRRALADAAYIPKAHFAYLERYILDASTDVDDVKSGALDNFWKIAGRVGKDRLSRKLSAARKNAVAYAKWNPWDEGDYYAGAAATDKFHALQKISAQFNDKARGEAEPAKTARKPTVKKKTKAEVEIPKPKKNYKL